MEYAGLGGSGIQVSRYCLGTMMFGAWGNADADECIAIVHTALDAGVNFVDTADVYDDGVSETIVGRALRGRRDDVVLATKGNNPMGDDPNRRGNSRRWITRAIEDSLRRLQTDWIDVYQIHRPDHLTDIDETLGALSDAMHAGKIRAIGTSTFPASEIVEAQWTARERSRERFTSEQPPYSILARGVEAEVLPVCLRYGVGAVVWAPLNGGWLSGKYTDGKAPEGSRAAREPDHFDFRGPVHREKVELVGRLAALAADAGTTLLHLAHAFVLEHPAVASVIMGPRLPGQLTEALAGADLRVAPDVMDAIDEIVPPGVNVNPADAGWTPPALADASRRRRLP